MDKTEQFIERVKAEIKRAAEERIASAKEAIERLRAQHSDALDVLKETGDLGSLFEHAYDVKAVDVAFQPHGSASNFVEVDFRPYYGGNVQQLRFQTPREKPVRFLVFALPTPEGKK